MYSSPYTHFSCERTKVEPAWTLLSGATPAQETINYGAEERRHVRRIAYKYEVPVSNKWTASASELTTQDETACYILYSFSLL
jgi:hypothetical protein